MGLRVCACASASAVRLCAMLTSVFPCALASDNAGIISVSYLMCLVVVCPCSRSEGGTRGHAYLCLAYQ